MSTGIEAIYHAALALPADSRAELAEKLLVSLDEKERAEIEAAWIAEVEDRLRAYDEGRMEAIPVEEVLRSLRARKRT